MEIVNQLKILMCGDSHARGLAWDLNKVRKSNDAVGFIKLRGRTRGILNSKTIEAKNLKEKYYQVLLCESNNVARNEAKEHLEGITEILNTLSYTNVVVINLPKRAITNLEPRQSCRQAFQDLNIMTVVYL